FLLNDRLRVQLRPTQFRMSFPKMRHGLLYIYELPPADLRFDEVVEHFEREGMSLAYPPTGGVLRVSHNGEDMKTTEDGIRKRLTNAEITLFKYYMDSQTSVFCSFDRYDKTTWRETHDLSGKTKPQSLALINSLEKLFAQRAEEGKAFAFVVDEFA